MGDRLTDERLTALLATVTAVGRHKIPDNTPCFWGVNDEVVCTYDELRAVIAEVRERRARDST